MYISSCQCMALVCEILGETFETSTSICVPGLYLFYFQTTLGPLHTFQFTFLFCYPLHLAITWSIKRIKFVNIN